MSAAHWCGDQSGRKTGLDSPCCNLFSEIQSSTSSIATPNSGNCSDVDQYNSVNICRSPSIAELRGQMTAKSRTAATPRLHDMFCKAYAWQRRALSKDMRLSTERSATTTPFASAARPLAPRGDRWHLAAPLYHKPCNEWYRAQKAFNWRRSMVDIQLDEHWQPLRSTMSILPGSLPFFAYADS